MSIVLALADNRTESMLSGSDAMFDLDQMRTSEAIAEAREDAFYDAHRANGQIGSSYHPDAFPIDSPERREYIRRYARQYAALRMQSR